MDCRFHLKITLIACALALLTACHATIQKRSHQTPQLAHANQKKLYLHLAQAAERQGSDENAKLFYQSALKQTPNNAVALQGLAGVYYRQHDYDQARDYYLLVLQAKPNDSYATQRLAQTALHTKNLPDALEYIQTLLSAYPKHAQAQNLLGMSLGRLREFERASQCFKSASTLAPKALNIRNNYGLSMALLGEYTFGQHYLQRLSLEYPQSKTLKANIRMLSQTIDQIHQHPKKQAQFEQQLQQHVLGTPNKYPFSVHLLARRLADTYCRNHPLEKIS